MVLDVRLLSRFPERLLWVPCYASHATFLANTLRLQPWATSVSLTSLATADLTWDFGAGALGRRICLMLMELELKGHEVVRAEVPKEKNSANLTHTHTLN